MFFFSGKFALNIKLKRKPTPGVNSPQIRSLALTFNFYLPKTYSYVRKTWNDLLPHPSTLRTCYSSVDGARGFTKEAFDALSLR